MPVGTCDITGPFAIGTVIAPPSPLNFLTGLVDFIAQTPGNAENLVAQSLRDARGGERGEPDTHPHIGARARGMLPIGADNLPLAAMT
jgi:hypothetical protein